MRAAPTIGVIIPTHNRSASLARTLQSLEMQSLSKDLFEVIIVDDGSTDDTPDLARKSFAFNIRYLPQKNQGATVARNHGAASCQSEILVFIDDDVTVSPNSLEALAGVCQQEPRVLVMGLLSRRSDQQSSVYAATMLGVPESTGAISEVVHLKFTDCNTELLACKRSDFIALGMLQDPTRGAGWPNWDDVEFGYRAHLSGFRLLQSNQARGDHWDYSAKDRRIACQRWYRASRSAAWLFKRHPELKKHIPMLYDKMPLTWRGDPPLLIARKLTRIFVSLNPVYQCLSGLADILERYWAVPFVLRRLYHLLQGVYMLRGYRDGLLDCERLL